jgi:hypothetical protein
MKYKGGSPEMNPYHPMTGADVPAIEVVGYRVAHRGMIVVPFSKRCRMGLAGKRTRAEI